MANKSITRAEIECHKIIQQFANNIELWSKLMFRETLNNHFVLRETTARWALIFCTLAAFLFGTKQWQLIRSYTLKPVFNLVH